MKKTLLTLTLLCVTLTLHALDYRQVIFWNSYENILEVDANSFFAENTEVKKEADFYRVYEQKIGRETFYRVLAMDKNYTDTMLLDWKNVSFTQDLYVAENNDLRLLIADVAFREESEEGWWRDGYTMGGIEIIERKGGVIGIMQFYNKDSTEDISYTAFSTLYYRWKDILEGNNIAYTIESYVQLSDSVEYINALVDERRPFMYTMQNAFDGNPTTSFVPGVLLIINKVEIEEEEKRGSALPIPNLKGMVVINGYASGEYYHQNNQIAGMSIIGYNRGLREEFTEGYLYLEDTVKPQVMMFQNDKKDFDVVDEEDIRYRYIADVEKIIKGTKYNDTPLAEIDFYLEGMGWLFGFADEENAVDLSTVNTKDGLRYEFNDNTATVITYNGNDTEITIPSEVVHNGKTYTVTAIGESAFENNKKITKVEFPHTLVEIGRSAFEGCEKLLAIIVPNTVTKIEPLTFKGCAELKTIQLPLTLTDIGFRAFEGTAIQKIKIPEGVPLFEGGTFRDCIYLESVVLPSTLQNIENLAFENCKNLISITIPENVKEVSHTAFEGCENLVSITFLGKETQPFILANNALRMHYVYKDSQAFDYVIRNNLPYTLLTE